MTLISMSEREQKLASELEQARSELAQTQQIVEELEKKLRTNTLHPSFPTAEQLIADRNIEGELQKSEALFRSTFEQVAVGMAHNALDGRWLRVNQRLCEITGYSKNELMAITFQVLSHPDDLPQDLAYVQQAIRGEIDTYSMEKRYFRKDHSVIWVRLTVTIIRTEDGVPDHFVSVIEDINQLKETEQALIESEKRYRQIIEAQEDAICHFLPDYYITFVNNNYAQRFFRTEPAEIVGKNLLELLPPDYQQEIRTLIASLNQENISVRSEISFVLPNGETQWIEWNNRAIFDENGKVTEYQVVGRDTTNRRLIEDEERKQRRYAEALSDSLTALTESRDIDQFMQRILSNAFAVVPADASSIALFEGNIAHVTYLHGFSEQAAISLKNFSFPVKEGRFQKLISDQQPYNIADTSTDREWFSVPETRWIRSTVGVPIVIDKKMIGILHVDSATPDRFLPEDIAKLQDFARHASLALEHAYYVDKLEERVRERTAELEAYANEIDDLYNNAPCGYHSLDKNGYFARINDTELSWLGYRREEVIGKLRFSDLCTAQGVEDFARYFPLLREQGWVKNLEYDLIRKDGSMMRVLLSATAIYDEHGNYVRSRSMLYDITPLKQAQETVRQQRDLLQLIIDTVPTIIVLKDENGRYEMVNQNAASLYGITVDEMLGRSDFEIHPDPEEMARFAEQDRVVRETGQPLFLPDNYTKHNFFQTSIIPLKNNNGEVNRLLVVSNDITHQKRIEFALSEQRDFLNTIINNIPAVVIVKDQDGRFEMANKFVADLFGVTPQHIIGLKDEDLNPNQNEVAVYNATDKEVLESGLPIFIPDDHIMGRFYATSKIPLKNLEGVPDRILVVATDITEHKQAQDMLQQALQKEKELSDLRNRFVSMTSHEFRTPLTAILATAETLGVYRKQLTDEQIDKRLHKIIEQVNDLRSIMEDVLKLSRLRGNRIELNLTEFDLDRFCQQLLDELRSEFVASHEIQYHCDGSLSGVRLDKKLLSHVINNLLSNAIKYSPNSEAIIFTVTHEGPMVVFKVSDHGIGIPEADLKHLFEPFHRAINVGSLPGTGLGLAIAKESVEMHGGTLTVESVLGSGTTFTAKIPLRM